jgi:RNA polymerase sigma-70 factor (ECF subfamily)
MIEAGVLEGYESEADASRLGQLFDTHHDRLYRLARRLSATREEAQDLVQDAFLRAATANRRMPQGAEAEEAWLVRVLINLSRDRWRRQKVRASNRREAADEASPAPEAAYIARLEVQRALAALAPRRRAVVVLHEMEGFDTAAVARLLGISAVTVRWHLSRARGELARVLDGGPLRSTFHDREA